ncbi:hypothetical protein Stuart_22 [Providencia phage vB_PstP_PS3]|uniref:Uncharacterized protein n=1 Tax=Providencia phage vB_PstP_PS3 TaxID=2848038 RepID=A0A411AWF8_9CAUD|nr:hypothetical protein HOV05_gp22 [Providencia phage vB_PstP_PS3]QAX92419.1 hypothetical protein Stuart_22 [Providencia phage vB_PstP_PS3]
MKQYLVVYIPIFGDGIEQGVVVVAQGWREALIAADIVNPDEGAVLAEDNTYQDARACAAGRFDFDFRIFKEDLTEVV